MDKFPNIDKVGVELEGGWSENNPDVDVYEDLKGDGSVDVNDDDDDNYHNGEMVSPPYSRWASITKFITQNYPDKVNTSCGFHIHISVPSVGYYQALMNKRFYNHLKYALAVWGRKNKIPKRDYFWYRLSGKNTYCEDEFRPNVQVMDRSKSGYRYSIVNYCFSLHGTMEIRVLPMFRDPDMSISALHCVLKCVDKYLSLPSSHETEVFTMEHGIEAEVDTNYISAIA